MALTGRVGSIPTLGTIPQFQSTSGKALADEEASSIPRRWRSGASSGTLEWRGSRRPPRPSASGKFDPSTEEWTSYSLPTIGTKTHGLQAVTVNGRTQIGMGYLGAGKVAKLEFRSREELQRLKSETRP